MIEQVPQSFRLEMQAAFAKGFDTSDREAMISYLSGTPDGAWLQNTAPDQWFTIQQLCIEVGPAPEEPVKKRKGGFTKKSDTPVEPLINGDFVVPANSEPGKPLTPEVAQELVDALKDSPVISMTEDSLPKAADDVTIVNNEENPTL